MTTTLERISILDYLKRERDSMQKTEYVQGVERKMTGATYNHNCIVVNLIKKISDKIDNKRYKILSSDQKIWIPEKQAFYYPDVFILTMPPQFYDEKKDIITNPICIFEVLCESTRNYDKAEKFDSYRTIPSFLEYYLVEQDKQLVIQYIINSKGNWELIEYKDLQSKIP